MQPSRIPATLPSRRSVARAAEARPARRGRRHVSAWTVAVLAVLMASGLAVAASGLVPAALSLGAVSLGARATTAALIVAVAGVGLGIGWPELTGIPLTVSGRVVMIAAGVIAGSGVAVRHDMASVTVAAGLGVVCLFAAELLVSPAPRDLSAGRPEGGRTRAAPGASDGRGPTPMTTALPGAVTGALVATAGACWVALAANPQWSATVVISCLVVLTTVVGDQIGRTYRSNSLGALSGGVLGGLAVGGAYAAARHGGATLPRVLPVLAQGIGDIGAVVVAGLATGVSVALAVIAIDGLLGDHSGRRSSTRGALSRGCAKFLVAVVPFYVMIRIGGI